MDYYCYTIEVEPGLSEALLGLIADLPFDTFEEEEGLLKAYLPAQNSMTEVDAFLIDIQGTIPFTYQISFIPYQNWNELWESNFTPIQIDHFCAVRAPFHDPITDVQHEIVIQPKMAFGTGHHETTYMMMAGMQAIDFDQKKVLDFGCGTGILAILAEKLGATTIDAIDIEEASFENTKENAIVNCCEHIIPWLGELDLVENNSYDIILANINRNVIFSTLASLYRQLQPGGTLLISGILTNDEPEAIQRAEAVGFSSVQKDTKGKWSYIHLTKPRISQT
ncbi:MAG TPA: 50S ribosomal protein L11 methyltransferase [Saprospiraceae bacterium]|nr:50S ribosomal protein L11 methyltransferase [Saprospiraceae bacterium]HMQ84081.1 50S ribosomal protein L11 methyltransferase [Saprospiraceae bacterium]